MTQKFEQYLTHFLKYGIFACLFIPLIVTPFTLFPFVFGKATAFQIIVQLLFAGWLPLVYLNRKHLPRPSIILFALGAWFLMLILSTITSANPFRSFWSTVERREGLVLFIHLAAFFLILVSLFRSGKDWTRLFQASVFVSLLVSLYTILQLLPIDLPFISPSTSLVRPGGPLGNPVYVGTYLLFHIFLSILLFYSSQNVRKRVVYGSIAGFQLAIALFLVSAKAASLGIVCGLFVALALWIFFEARAKIKPLFIIASILLFSFAGFLFFATTTGLIEKNIFISQYFNLKINFDSPGATGKQRMLEWGAALQGIRERPFFGWGLDNFPLLYDKYFPPEHPYYFATEHQVGVDRAHSIYFDWASTTGVLGLLGFLGIIGAAIFTLFQRWRAHTVSPPVAYILIGIFVAYLTHGIFTFDTLNSYIPLFLVIGFIHFISESQKSGDKMNPEKSEGGIRTKSNCIINMMKQNLAVLVAGILLFGALLYVIYFVDIKPLQSVIYARQGIIVRSAGSVEESLVLFEKSFSLNTFSNNELSINLANSFDPKQKEYFEKGFGLAESELKTAIKNDPFNVKNQLAFGKLYNKKGAVFDTVYLDKAEEVLEYALALSPTRQELYYEIGATEIFKKEFEKAEGYFQTACDLDPRFPKPWWFLGISQIASGNLITAKNTLDGAISKTHNYPALGGFSGAKEAYWISLAYQRIGYFPESLSYFEKLLDLYPEEITFYPILAGLYAGEGHLDKAVKAARKAAEINPQIKPEIDQFLNYLERLKELRGQE